MALQLFVAWTFLRWLVLGHLLAKWVGIEKIKALMRIELFWSVSALIWASLAILRLVCSIQNAIRIHNTWTWAGFFMGSLRPLQLSKCPCEFDAVSQFDTPVPRNPKADKSSMRGGNLHRVGLRKQPSPAMMSPDPPRCHSASGQHGRISGSAKTKLSQPWDDEAWWNHEISTWNMIKPSQRIPKARGGDVSRVRQCP